MDLDASAISESLAITIARKYTIFQSFLVLQSKTNIV